MRPRAIETPLVVTSCVMWLGMIALAAFGHWFAALYVLLGLLLVYGLLGSMHDGQLDWRLVAVFIRPSPPSSSCSGSCRPC